MVSLWCDFVSGSVYGCWQRVEIKINELYFENNGDSGAAKQSDEEEARILVAEISITTLRDDVW